MYLTNARSARNPKMFNCRKVATVPIFDTYRETPENTRVPTSSYINQDMRIENFLTIPIYVLTREGYYSRLPPLRRATGEASVQVTIISNWNRGTYGDVDVGLVDAFDLYSHNPTPAVTAIKDGLLPSLCTKNGNVVTKNRYHITERDLNESPTGLYIHELDLVIATDQDAFPKTLHPYSEAARRCNQILADADGALSRNPALQFTAVIVDNDANYNPRFIRIGNSVYKVPNIKDPERKNGVYIGGIGNGDTPESATHTSRYYTLTEAESKVPLFLSMEEASSGMEIAARTQEVKILKEQLDFKQAQLIANNEELKVRAEEAIRKAEIEAIRAQLERERLQEEATKRQEEATRQAYVDSVRKQQDDRHRRSGYRQEITEGIKVIAGLISAYLMYKKLTK